MRILKVAAWLAGALAVAAVSVPSQAGPLDERIVALAFRYQPDEVTLAQGEPLEFTNLDVAPHDVTAIQTGPDGLPVFATDTIGAGETELIEGLDRLEPGVYDFTCTLHPEMLGTLYLVSADG